jgi:hypothetical protein
MNRTKQIATIQVSLYERYNDMNREDQKAFRDFCLEHIKITLKTVYNWISGKKTPRPLEQIAIASFLKTNPADVWF